MRILYIHGLDSKPNPERIGHLKLLGHEVWARHLDYRNEPQSYAILRDLCQEEHIEFLVGSSLGGFMAYWLGEELGIPGLLFNPALHVDPLQAGIDPRTFGSRTPFRWVVIGAQDDTVDPQHAGSFFEKKDNPQRRQRVIMCQWLGHQIDIDTFRETCLWAGLIQSHIKNSSRYGRMGTSS